VQREAIVMIETSVDDCNPQIIGYVLERALEMGALDAYTTPVQMKKNRPGVVITLLARPADGEALAALLLRETTSLGVRLQPCERLVLARRLVQVATPYGPITLKVAGEKATPEYEDCRAAALRHGVPLAQVEAAARAAFCGSDDARP
jgi:uncharacterized protein (DUF111 family)